MRTQSFILSGILFASMSMVSLLAAQVTSEVVYVVKKELSSIYDQRNGEITFHILRSVDVQSDTSIAIKVRVHYQDTMNLTERDSVLLNASELLELKSEMHKIYALNASSDIHHTYTMGVNKLNYGCGIHLSDNDIGEVSPDGSAIRFNVTPEMVYLFSAADTFVSMTQNEFEELVKVIDEVVLKMEN